MTTRVVVLGGGYAGVAAAKSLDKKLKKRNDIEITLIDKNPFHTLMTELHEVAAARVEPESVQISYRKIFGARKIRVVTDRIKTVDFQARKLVAEGREYPYDYLVIGSGGEPEFYGIHGIKKHAFTLWSFEDALRIRDHIRDTFRAAAAEPDEAVRKEMLTLVVAGAGFTGIELAGELMDWKRVLCRQHAIPESQVRIVVVEALGEILPNLPISLQRKARKPLERKGVELMLGCPIIGAEPNTVLLSQNRCIKTRTFIWTCGVQGSEFGANLSLTKGKCTNQMCTFATTKGTCGVKDCTFSKDRYVEGKRGRILANSFMQSPDYPNVYVVGDQTWYLENDKVVPQVVETAVQTAELAAHNIAAEIEGKPKKEFKSNYHGIMVSLGSHYGVAHVMGMKLTGIFAMAVKHLINIVHFLGVAGVNQVWGYLRHEFLDVRNGRSFIGAQAAGKTRGYWVAALRVFLGVMWLIEGITKVSSGWLDPQRIFIVPKAAVTSTAVAGAPAPTDATAAASESTSPAPAAEPAAPAAEPAAPAPAPTDATAAASESTATAEPAAPASEPAASAPAPVDATAAASESTPAATAQTPDATSAASASTSSSSTPAPLLAKPLGIYTWLVNTFVAKAPFLFQALIVLAEIGIGLALVGGLFTFLAAAASIGLCVMFIIGAMAGREIIWYIACAVVMLGGAGRAFGLDHWVMPWLQKWWNGTRLARKTYLYVDEPTK